MGETPHVHRPFTAVVAVLLLLLAGAACSDDGDDDAAPPATDESGAEGSDVDGPGATEPEGGAATFELLTYNVAG
ncbi:MAG TPA: hypothetical protein VK507_21220, partial [Iamia sp.]|nr:hypothetical protein [Iamia sp.]